MNISSLCHNFDDLQTLLAKINRKFNRVGTTEVRLKKSLRNININLTGYMTEHAQNEASYGEAVFYSKNSMNYIIRGDFKIYRKRNLSPFL